LAHQAKPAGIVVAGTGLDRARCHFQRTDLKGVAESCRAHRQTERRNTIFCVNVDDLDVIDGLGDEEVAGRGIERPGVESCPGIVRLI
jgi:hypothetical protein